MNYYIDIIDTTDDSHVLSLENASFRGLNLSWKGGDKKDDLFIVPSFFAFDIKAPSHSMGYFLDLFTGNEVKYRLEFRAEDDNRLFWQGHLLPDTYQEPYTKDGVFISITATDGLGRLKGKYLADDFYSLEKTVIEIYQACLAKTALEMDLRFAAAILHTSFKKYHEIYINTALFIDDNGNKKTCFDILDTLLKSMVCTLYQSNGYWYIEGLNIRHLATVTYDEYDFNGTYNGTIDYVRKIKLVDNRALVTPLVTMVAVYKTVKVAYDIPQPRVEDNLVQENNDGWAAYFNEIIYCDAYLPHVATTFAITSPIIDYRVSLFKFIGTSFDDMTAGHKVSLVKPVYVETGQEITVEIDLDPNVDTGQNEKTGLKIQVVLNGVVLKEVIFYYDPDLEDEDKELSYFKEVFIITESGYLDVYFFAPYSTWPGSVDRHGWLMNAFNIKAFNIPETFSVEDTVNDEYSIEKNIDLAFADEFSDAAQTFLLEKVNDTTTDYYDQTITVFNEFVSNGKRYIQVILRDANLCAEFPDSLYVGAVQINVLDVIYNWLGNVNEHRVEIDTAIGAGSPFVRIKKVANGFNRTTWQSWTDAIYRIETERYGQIVANIYRRMFLEPYEKIDCNVLELINYNDLTVFKYITPRRYVPINVSMDIDGGRTQLTKVLNYYHNSPGGTSNNISPILNVMDDFCIAAGVTSVALTSTAYDPDGYIVQHYWQIITGSGSSDDFNQANITVNFLPVNIDSFVFRCTVVDNGGAVVSKDVTVCRISENTIVTPYSCGAVLTSSVPPWADHITGNCYRKGVDFDFLNAVSNDYDFNVRLKVSPILCSAMTMDESFTEACNITHALASNRDYNLQGGGARVFKNGINVGSYQTFEPDKLTEGYIDFTFNPADDIWILIVGYQNPDGYMNTKVTLESITEINGQITVSNAGHVFYLTTTYTPR